MFSVAVRPGDARDGRAHGATRSLSRPSPARRIMMQRRSSSAAATDRRFPRTGDPRPALARGRAYQRRLKTRRTSLLGRFQAPVFNSCRSTTAPDRFIAYRHRLNLTVMKRAKHRASACCRWPGLLAEHVFRSCHSGVLNRRTADGDAISRSNAHALSGGISLRIRCWCMGACRQRKDEERNEVAHSW